MSELPAPSVLPPPVTGYQPPRRLPSERVVIQSPMSFTGSAARTWKLTEVGPGWLKVATIPVALLVILAWWAVIVCWYVMFGVLVVPWRLIRRAQRKRKLEERRHREMMQQAARR